MAEAARVLDYEDRYNYGSAAPARETFPEPDLTPQESPGAREWARQRERERIAEALENLPGVSVFAILGSVVITVMMIFVLLAQINYNEAVSEHARLSAQLSGLTEQQKKLEITFESVLDMKEVERYARDVLGMSKPESYQLAVVHSAASDKAEVLLTPEGDSLRDFGSFISTLLEYFK